MNFMLPFPKSDVYFANEEVNYQNFQLMFMIWIQSESELCLFMVILPIVVYLHIYNDCLLFYQSAVFLDLSERVFKGNITCSKLHNERFIAFSFICVRIS